MNNRNRGKRRRLGWVALLLLVSTGSGLAQGPGAGMARQREDMRTIHELFDQHQKIRRTVTRIDGGVETLTESDDPAVQALIIGHTQAMKERLVKRQPIRMWDPLFAALFKHADQIEMEVLPTARGVRVRETSKDPSVVQLIQAHADGVTEFVEVGPLIMHRPTRFRGRRPSRRASFSARAMVSRPAR